VLRGAGDPVERRAVEVLPAFVAANADQPDRPRTLVLRPGTDGRIRYALLRATGPRLGDSEVGTTPQAAARLARAVGDVASGRGGDDADVLASFGIRFVLLRARDDAPLVRTLDGVPGLARVGSPESGVLWALTGAPGRVRLVPPRASGQPVVPLPSAPVTVDTAVPAGAPGRLVVLAEAADENWRATLDGRPLQRTTVDRWAQGFVLPTDGGRLVVEHRDPLRQVLLWLAAGVLLLVVVLALPPIRATIGDDDDDDDDDEAVPA
jgi:hypothetical protein